jgi:hypothetical protein
MGEQSRRQHAYVSMMQAWRIGMAHTRRGYAGYLRGYRARPALGLPWKTAENLTS